MDKSIVPIASGKYLTEERNRADKIMEIVHYCLTTAGMGEQNGLSSLSECHHTVSLICLHENYFSCLIGVEF